MGALRKTIGFAALVGVVAVTRSLYESSIFPTVSDW